MKTKYPLLSSSSSSIVLSSNELFELQTIEKNGRQMQIAVSLYDLPPFLYLGQYPAKSVSRKERAAFLRGLTKAEMLMLTAFDFNHPIDPSRILSPIDAATQKLYPEFNDHFSLFMLEPDFLKEKPNIAFAVNSALLSLDLVTCRAIRKGDTLLTYYGLDFVREYSLPPIIHPSSSSSSSSSSDIIPEEDQKSGKERKTNFRGKRMPSSSFVSPTKRSCLQRTPPPKGHRLELAKFKEWIPQPVDISIHCLGDAAYRRIAEEPGLGTKSLLFDHEYRSSLLRQYGGEGTYGLIEVNPNRFLPLLTDPKLNVEYPLVLIASLKLQKTHLLK